MNCQKCEFSKKCYNDFGQTFLDGIRPIYKCTLKKCKYKN